MAPLRVGHVPRDGSAGREADQAEVLDRDRLQFGTDLPQFGLEVVHSTVTRNAPRASPWAATTRSPCRPTSRSQRSQWSSFFEQHEVRSGIVEVPGVRRGKSPLILKGSTRIRPTPGYRRVVLTPPSSAKSRQTGGSPKRPRGFSYSG